MWNVDEPRPVVAGDVVRGVKRMCNPVQGSAARDYYLDTIAGLREFCDGFAEVAPEIEPIRDYIEGNEVARRHRRRRQHGAVHAHPAGERLHQHPRPDALRRAAAGRVPRLPRRQPRPAPEHHRERPVPDRRVRPRPELRARAQPQLGSRDRRPPRGLRRPHRDHPRAGDRVGVPADHRRHGRHAVGRDDGPDPGDPGPARRRRRAPGHRGRRGDQPVHRRSTR